MGQSDFGERGPLKGFDAKVEILLEYANKVNHAACKLEGTLVHWLIREFYEEKYGVAHHDSKDPLSIVKFHPTEDFFKYGRRANLMRRYINDPAVKEKTGLSLKEFMSYPRHMTEALFELVEESKQIDKEQLEAIKAAAAAEKKT